MSPSDAMREQQKKKKQLWQHHINTSAANDTRSKIPGREGEWVSEWVSTSRRRKRAKNREKYKWIQKFETTRTKREMVWCKKIWNVFRICVSEQCDKRMLLRKNTKKKYIKKWKRKENMVGWSYFSHSHQSCLGHVLICFYVSFFLRCTAFGEAPALLLPHLFISPRLSQITIVRIHPSFLHSLSIYIHVHCFLNIRVQWKWYENKKKKIESKRNHLYSYSVLFFLFLYICISVPCLWLIVVYFCISAFSVVAAGWRGIQRCTNAATVLLLLLYFIVCCLFRSLECVIVCICMLCALTRTMRNWRIKSIVCEAISIRHM